MKSFPVDNVNIRRFDDVALIHAENAYELKDGRKGVSRYTDIWHKQNGRWLLHRRAHHRAQGTGAVDRLRTRADTDEPTSRVPSCLAC